MFSYSVVEWLFIFYIYCFLGWCFESAYVSLRTGHRVNRGFMKAPLLPLYGSGALLLLFVSKIFEGNTILTYAVGLFAATLLELFTGLIMERIFKIKYWNYSNQRFNFKGHICLTSSIAWGFMTLLVTRVLHGPIESMVLGVPEIIKNAVVLIVTAFLIIDFVYSLHDAWNLRSLLLQLKEAWGKSELREDVEDRLEHIQAELTAKFEVHISRTIWQRFTNSNFR